MLLPEDIMADVARYLSRKFIENTLRSTSRQLSRILNKCAVRFPCCPIEEITIMIDTHHQSIHYRVSENDDRVCIYDKMMMRQIPHYLSAKYIRVDIGYVDSSDYTIHFAELFLCVVLRSYTNATIVHFRLFDKQTPEASDIVRRLLEGRLGLHITMPWNSTIYGSPFSYRAISRCDTLQLQNYILPENFASIVDWLHVPANATNRFPTHDVIETRFTVKKGCARRLSLRICSPFTMNESNFTPFEQALIQRFAKDTVAQDYHLLVVANVSKGFNRLNRIIVNEKTCEELQIRYENSVDNCNLVFEVIRAKINTTVRIKAGLFIPIHILKMRFIKEMKKINEID